MKFKTYNIIILKKKDLGYYIYVVKVLSTIYILRNYLSLKQKTKKKHKKNKISNLTLS